MGDFNYPDIDWENWNTKGERSNNNENRFLESLQDNFLCQHTTKQIRWRGADTPHTLDLVITNEEEMISMICEIPEPKPIFIQNKLEELNINKDMVLKHLQKRKTDKSPGPDNLHPRLLFEVKEGIAEPLSTIFSQSLTKKVVLNEWKNALVSAIFEKGNKSQAKNYRPVSLTSVVCKIMEKIVREHIISHMIQNKLFSNKQYGFISGRSTALQLLEVIDKWTESLDNGHQVNCIYTNFMKAFDKVLHRKLVKKIEKFRIINPILDWITDFLPYRKQRVSVNGETSEWKEVTSGIPQCSVLGPLLFVLYINNLPDCVTSDAYLFA
ncbi:unnamed protein product [Mytilus coruscus]|uniref:Reverse transcriptase domain-containing protein n=1 Tax=Mytilus coruscus TaxID=42192 RepID=A0A6J8CAE5_MYTCO|nr:unnamed protein product [Mytilus coruscus]